MVYGSSNNQCHFFKEQGLKHGSFHSILDELEVKKRQNDTQLKVNSIKPLKIFKKKKIMIS